MKVTVCLVGLLVALAVTPGTVSSQVAETPGAPLPAADSTKPVIVVRPMRIEPYSSRF